MAKTPSFYWYDLETFGIDPKSQRIAQFAGVRTDFELNIIEDPLVMYCQPSNDFLPDPESCLITGITPQIAAEQGIPEPEFIKKILQKFSQPNTCVVGYNSIRFDDEFIRYTLYRNLYDPYEREWKNNNSRWDLIDLVRATKALRPEGINWPTKEEGIPSFKLEDLTVANDIKHTQAHDALSDVKATISIAKLIRDAQPRLFEYVVNHRDKHSVAKCIDVNAQQPFVHVSGMYKSVRGCIAVVLPIARHPINKNGIIVIDLSFDPSIIHDLSVAEIRERIYTAEDKLPDDVHRIPIKTIHLNRCPFVAPMSTLNDQICKQYGIDLAICDKHKQSIANSPEISKKLIKLFSEKTVFDSQDVDASLYSGFFSGNDKQKLEAIREKAPSSLYDCNMPFDDSRIPELLFRYRARNYPKTLTEEERVEWEQFRLERINGKLDELPLTLGQFEESIARIRSSGQLSEQQQTILLSLETYLAEEILTSESTEAAID